MRLVVHAPHAAVADDRRVEVRAAMARGTVDGSLLTQDDVVRARARRQLAVVGVARPRRGEDLALDLLDRVHVGLAHQLQRELLPDLDHQRFLLENDCMYSISRLRYGTSGAVLRRISAASAKVRSSFSGTKRWPAASRERRSATLPASGYVAGIAAGSARRASCPGSMW